MLPNAYFLAKFRFDIAENEPAKNLQNFAKKANFNDPIPLFRAGGEDENGRGRPQGAGGGARVHRAGPAAGLPTVRGRKPKRSTMRQNFGKMLLVFGCIGSDFCKKICVLQHFSKSTRFSS